jgi:hypothetical protein
MASLDNPGLREPSFWAIGGVFAGGVADWAPKKLFETNASK